MAGNIPQIVEPSVAPQPLRLPEASPTAFGAPIGQALGNLGQEAQQIAVNERHMAASFAAQDAELHYGEDNDKLEEGFKNDLKNPPAGVDFQKFATERLQKLTTDRQQLRSKYEADLTDPLARKSYTIRTRVQTQAAERQALLFADAHIDRWREQTNEGLQAKYIDQAGNVTGALSADVLNFSTHTGLAHDAYDKAHPGEPEEYREAKHMEIDKKAAIKAFGAYGDNYQAATAFLASKTTDGIRVGFDPKNPGVPSILNAAETKKLEETFTEIKNTKVGSGLGLEWKLAGVQNVYQKAREFIAQGPPEEKGQRQAQAFKAVQEYSSLLAHDYANQQHAEAIQFKSSYSIVADRYGRDVDAADRAGALSGVPTQVKDQLRELFRKRPDSSEFQRGRAMFGDVLVLGPGWSDNWKTEDDFAKDWLPKVGPAHFEELRHNWEQDQRRPKEQDTRIASKTAMLEDRLRVALDWADDGSPDRRHWSAADEWKQGLHEWAMSQWNEGVNRHHAETKTGKAGDPKWAEQLQNQIMEGILHGRKTAKKTETLPPDLFKARAAPALPASVRAYLTANDKPASAAAAPASVPDFPEGPEGDAQMAAWLQTPEGKRWAEQPAE